MEASGSQSAGIETGKNIRMHIQINDNTENKKMTVYKVFDYRFNYSEWDKSLYFRPELYIEKSFDPEMHITVEKRVKNVGMRNSQHFLDRISYSWEQKDTLLYLDEYLHTDDEDFWMFPEVDIKLRVPEGQVVVLSEEACDLLEPYQQNRYCADSLLAGKSSVMTAEGLMLLAKQKTASIKAK
jgi:hypothetical protein